jgi:four helix bundle protein
MQRSPAKSFQDLIVWQKAHKFVLSVYNFSDYFPQKEVCGLTVQLRRAASSIPICIAQSVHAGSSIEEAKLIFTAKDSLEECRYYLILAGDLGYGDSRDLFPQLEEVERLLKEYIVGVMGYSPWTQDS